MDAKPQTKNHNKQRVLETPNPNNGGAKTQTPNRIGVQKNSSPHNGVVAETQNSLGAETTNCKTTMCFQTTHTLEGAAAAKTQTLKKELSGWLRNPQGLKDRVGAKPDNCVEWVVSETKILIVRWLVQNPNLIGGWVRNQTPCETQTPNGVAGAKLHTHQKKTGWVQKPETLTH